MFFYIATCACRPQRIEIDGKKDFTPKVIHKLAFFADIMLGLAVLGVGIGAYQWGFLPSNWQFALMGSGATLSLSMFIALSVLLKKACVRW